MAFVDNFFQLTDDACDIICDMVPEFGYDGYGEFVFYRTYSRLKSDGMQESWADVVIRVINGTFSIRKDWYLRNYIPWDETYWQKYALEMAISLFKMEWLAPGRGLWAMGTNFVYERGSMALYNCAFTELTSENFADDIAWAMDSLMLGVGVGAEPIRSPMPVYMPMGNYRYIIPDTREGWVSATKQLITAFTIQGSRMPEFNYTQIRKKGLPIKGFGGKASGPEPLMKFHSEIIKDFLDYMKNPQEYDIVKLKANIMNQAGACVVAGNIRRSAEILVGEVSDNVFLDLKNYDRFPERESFGGMSNNTTKFYKDEHYEMLGEVANRVIIRGEPGVANVRNFIYGRIGKKSSTRPDLARGLNPCGEITLEHRETCNVVETAPTRCTSVENWYKACEYATTYACSVSLLPTHQPSTNRVVARNRRIGVSIIDYTGWRVEQSQHKVIRYLRKGYKIICERSKHLNGEAGVPEPIKKTTIKPGGTVPKLAGKTPGAGYPTFIHTLRNTRIPKDGSFHKLIANSGLIMEPEKWDPEGTMVVGYPIKQGPAKPLEQVSIWEQAHNIITLQSEWADNAVSNTLYFRPKWKLVTHKRVNTNIPTTAEDLFDELTIGSTFLRNECDSIWRFKLRTFEDTECKCVVRWEDGEPTELKLYRFDPTHEENDLEFVLSAIVPRIKTVSLCPHTSEGVYPQMPEVGISEEKYEELKAQMTPIDWSQLSGSDGEDERFCHGDQCELPVEAQ